MCYNQERYNNEECLREHIEWCQKFLELGGSMVDVVYMDEVGFNLHLTRHLEGLIQNKEANEFIPLRGVEICLW